MARQTLRKIEIEGMNQVSASGRVVYFNGELVPEAEAKISIYDSALMFGDMVFEMTRSFNGKQFKLKEHIEQMALQGAKKDI